MNKPWYIITPIHSLVELIQDGTDYKGYIVAAISLIACFAVSSLVDLFSYLVSKSYRDRLLPIERADWQMRTTSALHAILICYGGIITYLDQELHVGFLNGSSKYFMPFLFITLGYEIFDIYSMLALRNMIAFDKKFEDMTPFATPLPTPSTNNINTNSILPIDEDDTNNTSINDAQRETLRLRNLRANQNSEIVVTANAPMDEGASTAKVPTDYSSSSAVGIPMFLHHIFVISGIIIYLLVRKGMIVLVLFSFHESVSPFIQMRWMLIKSNLGNSYRFYLNGIFLLFFYIVCRILVFPYVFWLFIKSENISMYDIPKRLSPICLIGTSFLILLNCYWFVLLLRGIFYKCYRGVDR